jgi:hypothetical protein
MPDAAHSQQPKLLAGLLCERKALSQQRVIFNTGEFVSHNFWKADQGAKICLKKHAFLETHPILFSL